MNDKLDQIIVENNNKLLDAVNGRTNPTLGELVYPAKQAILTLFKEMIAEAKPHYTSEPNHNFGADHQTGINEGYNIAITEFEQNLIKLLV